MFERFSAQARSAVVAAQVEARELSASRIGSEHLLLGVVVVESESPLGEVFAGIGLTPDQVRADLARGTAERPLGEADAAALRSIGIDLDAVRDSLEASFGADALAADAESGDRKGWFARRTGHVPFTPQAKKALELALREALARKDSTIGAEHVVLGLLRGADPATLAVITPHVDADELRRQVVAVLDRVA